MGTPASTSTTESTAILTDFDLHLFHEGTHSRLYEKLGAHAGTMDGTDGTTFAVWAPNAKSVSVVGDFNGWNEFSHPLVPPEGSGIWSGFVSGLGSGGAYAYQITSWRQGYRVCKGDPCGYRHGPDQRSFIWDLGYHWNDRDWMNRRHFAHQEDAAVSIYQVHLGSWMRVPEEGNRIMSYRELAQRLADHVSSLGFSHVELLPIMEHPELCRDDYEISGYFAPDHRHGAPQDLMFLIDHLHQRNIGVILDWPCGHFSGDGSLLEYFDGTHLYEHGPWEVKIPNDGSGYTFDFSRPEVRSFLLSNAFFWIDKYHADGLRLDALSAILHLNFGRRNGEWVPNAHGGRENLDAIQFLKQLTLEVGRQYPDVPTVAQDTSAWPMLTQPAAVGGLGFSFKWDQTFAQEVLEYFQQPPFFRKFHHNYLTARSAHAFAEKFVIPLSDQEVAPPGKSLLARMPGDDWQKFANLRLLLGCLWLQPGKKLLFMGGEFGQWSPWNRGASLDWHLCAFEMHQKVQLWVGDLNRLYKEQPALSLSDAAPEGFAWVEAQDSERSTLSWIRRDPDHRELLLVACNFTPNVYRNVRLGVERGGFWREVLNSDAREYGGSGQGNFGGSETSPFPSHGFRYAITLTLPPLGVVVLKHERGGL